MKTYKALRNSNEVGDLSFSVQFWYLNIKERYLCYN